MNLSDVIELSSQLYQALAGLSWIGEKTLLLQFTPASLLDAHIEPLVNAIPIDYAYIKYATALFLTYYPLAALRRALPHLPHDSIGNPLLLLAYVFWYVFFAQWVFGAAWIHAFLSSFVTFLLCVVGSFINNNQYTPTMIFVWVMIYMATVCVSVRVFSSFIQTH